MAGRLKYSFLCFGVALYLFLFASVERISLTGNEEEALTDQRALEVASGKGLLPVRVNLDTWQNIDAVQVGDDYTLVRHVGVAYLGNIVIMFVFLVSGLLLRSDYIMKVTG